MLMSGQNPKNFSQSDLAVQFKKHSFKEQEQQKQNTDLPPGACPNIRGVAVEYKNPNMSLGRMCKHGVYCTKAEFLSDWQNCPIYKKYSRYDEEIE
jgi:hypothetical protein